jgi:glycosyltransferase involved in cell wall biosynthesis
MAAETSLGRVDIDFTLGLNNKTGKYYFGRDMIEASRDLTDKIWYWRRPHAETPQGLYRRILGRLARWDVNLRRKYNNSFVPLFRPRHPLVFTDPREVIYAALKPWDVVLVHDVGPLSHPELYDADTEATYRKAFLKMQAVKPFLLFVSESSRDAYAEYFGRDYAAMRITYINPRKELEADPAEPVIGVPEKFLLTVGAIGRRKNHAEALKAYAQSGLNARGIAYVICGGPEPGAEAVMNLARQTPGVILTGYLPDAQLNWLYSQSLGFVLPSLLEGFGVPAMEAILHGAVPLVTRGGALNEVTGDSAILVDEDAASICDGMLKLADLDADERQSRLAAMRGHIRKFDWEGAVSVWRQTLQDAIALHAASR